MYQSSGGTLSIQVCSRFRFLGSRTTISVPTFRQTHGKGFNVLGTANGTISTLLVNLTCLFMYLGTCNKTFNLNTIARCINTTAGFFINVNKLFATINSYEFGTPCLGALCSCLSLPGGVCGNDLAARGQDSHRCAIRFQSISFQCPNDRRCTLHRLDVAFGIKRQLTIINVGNDNGAAFVGLLYHLCSPARNIVLLGNVSVHGCHCSRCVSVFSIIFRSFGLFTLPLNRGITATRRCSITHTTSYLRGTNFSSQLTQVPGKLSAYLCGSLSRSNIAVSNNRTRGVTVTQTLCGSTPFVILSRPATTLSPITRTRVCTGFGRVTNSGATVCVDRQLSSYGFYSRVTIFSRNRIIRRNARRRLLKRPSKGCCRL